MGTAVFLFHRDLRTADNTGLLKAMGDGHRILPVFIFPPEQIDPKRNAYFSHPAVQFMCESLEELQDAVPLLLMKGESVAMLKKLHAKMPFGALYTNRDNSVYATARDALIEAWCECKKIQYVATEDYTLLPLKEGLVDPEAGRPYSVLAPFYNRFLKDYRAHKIKPVDARPIPSNVWASRPRGLPTLRLADFYEPTPQLIAHGGRRAGKAMLKRVTETMVTYGQTRDIPALTHGTTIASPHLKFGTVSIREMLAAAMEASNGRVDTPLVREIVFREFYHKIYALTPALQRGKAFHEATDKQIPWSYDKAQFQAWCEGRTGFPMVDAGMRQLNATGWMHNRVRMLVATFLSRYLLIDWRWGEKYFAQKLVDVDAYSNVAGWQWSAAIGVDAMGYRAPMNPFRQSVRFDAEAEYIKRWVPELADVPAKDIHKWGDAKLRAQHQSTVSPSYPAPIVEAAEVSRRAVEVFKKIKK